MRNDGNDVWLCCVVLCCWFWVWSFVGAGEGHCIALRTWKVKREASSQAVNTEHHMPIPWTGWWLGIVLERLYSAYFSWMR